MMNRTVRILLGLGLLGLLVVGGIFAYIWFAGGNTQASAPLSAPTVEAAASALTFDISTEQSEVRFLLDEDLRGERITVTGRTDQVAGQIAVDFANPANSELGVIRINTRNLVTDNEFRNRAIRTAILQTDQYEFIEFTPTEVSGLPTSVTFGEAFTFQVAGNLQIRAISQPVTFNVTVTPVDETSISGTARAVVTRTQYELTIPNVPSVANVEEEVEIELDFVATTAAS
jgi:polyisoprenoid-binding protein YceI